MTKAAVKVLKFHFKQFHNIECQAMDTVHNFLTDDTAPEELLGLGLNPDKFIVGGASKEIHQKSTCI